MKRILVATALAAIPLTASATGREVLHDPIALNIGVNCQWQVHCMAEQRRAMNRSLSFVERSRPPQWRIQLCNRNARRGGNRVDWIGFDHCIRNPVVKAEMQLVKARRR
jgi:hypothetical protein